MGKIRFFGSIVLLSLIIQAANFNLEKSLYGDSAFLVFRLLNEEVLPIEHNRYVGSLPHVPAYFASKLGASPSIIFKLYSMGPWLVLLGLFGFLVYLKKPVEALTLVIVHTWFMRESFFITTEVPIAAGFALLYSAFLWWKFNDEPSRNNYLKWSVGLIGAIGAIFSHPIGLIFLFFLLGWKCVQSFSESRKWIYFSLPLLLVLPLRYFLFTTSTYEGGFFAKAFDDLSWIQNFKELYSVYFFFNGLNGFYTALIIIWILGLLRLNTRESRPAFFVSLIGIPLLWVLIMATFRDGDANPMQEKSYLAIVFPIIYIFLFRTYQLWKGIGGLTFIMIWIVSIWSIGKTINQSQEYSKRLYHLDKIVEQQTKNKQFKLFVSQDKLKAEYWMVTWALPFESILLSLNKSGFGQVTLKNIPESFSGELLPNFFYGPDFYLPSEVDSLNPKYFKLSDSQWENGNMLFE